MKKSQTIKKGFTLAEILITLTVIGIVAALTIPALLANVEEKVYVTQKKALHARLTQAIAQFDKLSGYTDKTDIENSAETFVLQLSKVYKMNSVCGYTKISSCNFPEIIAPMNGSGRTDVGGVAASIPFISGGKGLKLGGASGLNSDFPDAATSEITNYQNLYPAAFTTPNGESVVVYYNPKCATNLSKDGPVQNYVCLNFLYDLNGKKAPNQIGKDMGFITVFSNRNSAVAGPIPYAPDVSATFSTDGTADPTENPTAPYEDSISACQSNDSESRLPNIDELSSIYVNKKFLGRTIDPNKTYWSGTAIDSTNAWAQIVTGTNPGNRIKSPKSDWYTILCVRK